MRTQRAVILSLAILGLLFNVACASTGGGGAAAIPPEQQIESLLDSITTALSGADIETMMSYYSDDFMSDQGQDKAATTTFLSTVAEQGFLEGVEIDNTSRTIAVDGDTATVEGVGLSGAFGVLTLGFKLENRDGNWVVTYQSQQ